MSIYNFNPFYVPFDFVGRVRHKRYEPSKGERKRCKSCKHFDKHLTASSCALGKRRYTSPNDIACDSHERRKR